jgi:AcrR family transcriptional regulator
MARTRSPRHDEVRRHILACAASAFAGHGYAGTSIGDVARACGMSKGALYHYFASKEALLAALLEGHVADLHAALVAALEPVREPEARLRTVLAASLAIYASSRSEQIVLLNDLAALDPDAQARVRALEDAIVELYAGLIENLDHGGRVDRRTRKVYAMMLLGMINYTYTWFDPAGPVSPAELAARAADLALQGLIAVPRTRRRTAQAGRP